MRLIWTDLTWKCFKKLHIW